MSIARLEMIFDLNLIDKWLCLTYHLSIHQLIVGQQIKAVNTSSNRLQWIKYQ